MIKKISVFCFLLFSFYSAPSKGDSSCHSIPRPVISVEIISSQEDVTYIFDYTAKEITERAKNIPGISDLKHVHRTLSPYYLLGNTMGLTVAEYGYEIALMPAFIQSGNLFCPSMNRIALRFYYKPTIYIAKDYKPNKCAFQMILDHEHQHHKINLKNKKKYMGWLQTDLSFVISEILKNYRPVSSPAKQGTLQQVRKDIEDAIDVYISKMYQDSELQNQELDKPWLYAKLSRNIKECYKD